MKKLFKKAYIFGITLTALVIIFQQAAGSAVTDKTVSVSGTATKPVTAGAILDDFNTDSVINKWSCRTGTFGSLLSTTTQQGYCAKTWDAAGQALRLDYNVENTASFAGYYSQMGGGSLASPTAYTAISFSVKGALGGEFFKVELKNNGANADTNHAAVYVTDYLDSGVMTDWQQVTIPFHNFANISDWSSGSEFCITFEGDQSGLVGSSKQGTIYIDNITFVNSAVSAVRINSFTTKLGRSALGGGMGSMPNPYPTISWASYDFSDADYNSAPYSLLSQYDVSAGDQWAGHFMLFGGGNSGDTAIPHNFNGFNYLSFYVKARSAAENSKVMKIELADSGGNKYYVVTGISESSWLPVKILLTNFKDDSGNVLNKTAIKQLNIIYERWRISGAGGKYNGPGAVYIDDIRFEQ